MTKEEEISILKEAVAKLGPDSYCGPWLQEQIGFIRSDIVSDMMPSPTMREAQKLHASAIAHAGDIVSSGQAEADRQKEDAYRRINMEVNRVMQALNAAQHSIGRMI